MIHKDKGLIVYVDCQPSEQLIYNDEIVACFVALICPDPNAFSKYKQYKEVPADERPLIAEQIADDLSSAHDIYCIGSEGNYSSIKKIGNEFISKIIDKIEENIIEEYKEGYKIYGRKLNSNVAVFIPWYANTLLIMGYYAAKFAYEFADAIDIKKITFSLDRLPGDPKAAMEFIKLMSSYPAIFNCWKKLEGEFGVNFEFANMQYFTDPEGNRLDSRLHPGMILIDWVVHSIFNYKNKIENIDKGTRSESYRKSIMKPFDILVKNNRINLLPFYGIGFIKGEGEAKKFIEHHNLKSAFHID